MVCMCVVRGWGGGGGLRTCSYILALQIAIPQKLANTRSALTWDDRKPGPPVEFTRCGGRGGGAVHGLGPEEQRNEAHTCTTPITRSSCMMGAAKMSCVWKPVPAVRSADNRSCEGGCYGRVGTEGG